MHVLDFLFGELRPEEMKVENPLVESRATTTIKLINVEKYLAEKNSIGIRINQLGEAIVIMGLLPAHPSGQTSRRLSWAIGK